MRSGDLGGGDVAVVLVGPWWCSESVEMEESQMPDKDWSKASGEHQEVRSFGMICLKKWYLSLDTKADLLIWFEYLLLLFLSFKKKI